MKNQMRLPNVGKYPAIPILLLFTVTAQAQNPDWGIWTAAEMEKKLGRWRLNGEMELRTNDNAAVIDRWSVKVGGDYALMKNMKLGAAYEFLHFHDVEYTDYQPRHRLITYAQGKQKWGNFVFSLRERFQVTTKDDSDRIKKNGKTDTYKINPAWSWRNRLKVAYEIPRSRFTPAASVETFYQLNNPEGNRFDGVRTTLSVACRLDGRKTIELSGIYHKEVNLQKPQDKLVASIGYIYSF